MARQDPHKASTCFSQTWPCLSCYPFHQEDIIGLLLLGLLFPFPPSVARIMTQRPKKESYLRGDQMVRGTQCQRQVPCTLSGLAPALPDSTRIFHDLHRQARGSVCQTKSVRLAPVLKPQCPHLATLSLFGASGHLSPRSSFPNGSTLPFSTIYPQLHKGGCFYLAPLCTMPLYILGSFQSLVLTVVHCRVGTLKWEEEIMRNQKHVGNFGLFPIQVMNETADLES